MSLNASPILNANTIPYLAYYVEEADTPKVNLPYPISDYYDFTTKPNARLDLGLPSNIDTKIVYNTETGMYEVFQKIGDRYYRRPTAMTQSEYMAYERKKSINDYFTEKVESENSADQNIIPTLNVKGEAFDLIFGGDEISIRPQGSAELSFGVNISKYENPALPIQSQRQTQFDFDQQIQLNLVGQIGDKLKLEIAQNTSGATFNFQNQVKIGYTGYEDEIIQKIEAGNVSLPLNTTLIQGSQSLFGIRTDLKFGKLTVNTLLSQQRGQRQEINVAGGAQQQEFEVKADSYEENKHYFLNFYHRENYNNAMASMPYVNSGVNITKIEVYITNRNNDVENTRNFVAFTDLGENDQAYLEGNPTIANIGSDLPDNDANNLYQSLINQTNVRYFTSAVEDLKSLGTTSIGPFEQSFHYEKVENARRLTEQEFTYNALLGFVSLRQSLNQDEVLAVAYQYTYQGKTYQVGEFSNDVPVETGSKSALILKLIKPTIVNPKNKLWDLMMKNVYSLGAYQVGETNFKLDVWYNNPETSVDVNYLPYEGVDDKMLLQYLDLDRLNLNTERSQDGRFDFVPFIYDGNKATNGGTIDARTGRVYFATIEPFGTTLNEKLTSVENPLPPYKLEKIIYQELYDSTRTAAQQLPDKNRFKIKGTYESSVSSDIPLNALNIPEGSVTVTAGGASLIEGVDFQVDYNLGRVQILNEGILESQIPITVSLESNSGFGFQQKSLVGAHFNYEFNKDFNLGATVMNLTEKPVTQKVNVGSEPVSNTVLGTDIRYRTEVPFITKMIDFLPIISTKEKSFVTTSGEFAYLIPGTQRAIGEGGISYIDGFEGSQSGITLTSSFSWKLASIPQGLPNDFPEYGEFGTKPGFNRSKLAWYTIDQSFYIANSRTPDNIRDNDTILNDSRMRMVLQQDLFPQTQPTTGTVNNIQVFDLAYYPQERGPYNYDTTAAFINTDGTFNNPQDRWAGIMRAMTTTNFETANVQYIQFWMLDPYNSNATDTGVSNLDPGELYFNLGNISEDILPDSRKSYENGLPISTDYNPADYDSTSWGIIPNQQVIVNAFDNNNESREFQDIGLDGLNNQQEASFFAYYTAWVNNSNLSTTAKNKLLNDISSDGYNYYLDDDYDLLRYDILQRYKEYNGHEGNSNTSAMSANLNAEGYPTQGTTTPDIEDINQDNNLGETENYFQYKVNIASGGFIVGQNYITNSQVVTKVDGGTETWYQFKIPINAPDKIVNNISDFRSIRFMRMYMKGFENPKILRFATLELIRGTWREFAEDLQTGEQLLDDPNSTEFVIGAVNLEENEGKIPVNYAIPDGIQRENDYSSINTRQLNEQSMSLEVCGLKDGDAKAAYKSLNLDIRNYGQIEMFVHAETNYKTNNENLLKDNDINVFVRLGTDFTDNYYEYEVPLKLTPWNTSSASPELIWPEENNVTIVLDDLISLKLDRDDLVKLGLASTSSEYMDTTQVYKYIKVKGNPNLSEVKVVMIGVRNPDDQSNSLPDDGLEKCAEVWVNELRMTNFKQNGGYAATAQVNVQMADFGNLAVSGSYSTPDWGSIESTVSERQRETISNLTFNSNFELGQFFGDKIALRLPAYFGYSVGAISPEYDPLAPDVKMSLYDPEVRKEKELYAKALTIRKSYNFTNVRKERRPGKEIKFWDVENISLSYSYNELYRRDINTTKDITRNYRAGINYAFSAKPKLIEPFKKMGFVNKSKWFRIIKDFNFYLGPKSFSMNNDIQRMYNELQNRNALVPEFIFAPTYYKNFTWNRAYTFKYDISKNLKFNYNAINASIIREPQGEINKTADQGTLGLNNYNSFLDIVNETFNPFSNAIDTITFGGYNMNFGQNFDITYKLPFDKIPLTDWITANVTYGGNYDWMRAPIGQDSLGNTIQNARNFTLNGQFNLISLYNKVPYFQKVNRGGSSSRGKAMSSRSTRGDSDGENAAPTDKKKAKKDDGKMNPIGKSIAQLIMTLRNVSMNYSITDGMLLPGFEPSNSLIGLDNDFSAPSFAFITGAQNYDLIGRQSSTWGADSSYAYYAANKGWLVEQEGLNIQHNVMHTQNISGRATLEPIKDLSINLTVNRTLTKNQNSNFRFNEELGRHEYQNPLNTGTLNFSTITWRTAFENSSSDSVSNFFNEMLANRSQYSKLFGEEAGTALNSDGYYQGYGANQQDVLVASFLNTYTGNRSSNKITDVFKMIPLPNWDIRYDGLSKLEFMKKYVRNFTIKHGYRSNISISNFSTNLAAKDEDGVQQLDNSLNFIADEQYASIIISEQFAPLFGIDATWIINKNGLITKFEYKKDRSLSLNIANSQIIEMVGKEIVIGTGYRFSQVELPFEFMGKKPKSDVNIRFDLSIRNTLTVSRSVTENSVIPTSGQEMYSIRSSVDYNLGKNLNARVYFDRTVNVPALSSAFKTANTRAGIALRFNLAQ
ncbi:cell surface protein SprA [Putridiphycobacter roseus]|uniref:T9SS outer membrane translocon Sov/SprA n=1 Tax=Putridiphycobacter roseus TaxID=2219161 RepID=UPI0013146991|nr:cell surface protein SprA [Putridiphycobacter roseus]